jgi:hypothetical protein
MPTRLVFFLFALFVVPALCQTNVPQQMSQKIWARGQPMRPDSPPELDPRAVRLQAIHQDAGELSALSASLQSDLQQLQKGILPKHLPQNLKKVEKLSRKLRQEVAE